MSSTPAGRTATGRAAARHAAVAGLLAVVAGLSVAQIPAPPTAAPPEPAGAVASAAVPPRATPPVDPGPARAQLQALAWLAGCWQLDGREAGNEEHWLPLAGDTLLGVSRTVRAGRTVGHEFMQIRIGDDGRVGYVAQPSGQAPARFPLRDVDADGASFENAAHDFPQRIVYRRVAPDRLHARIEGTLRGTARAVDYPMTRRPCEGGATR